MRRHPNRAVFGRFYFVHDSNRLFVAQLGRTEASAKPWKGLGSGVYEPVGDHRGDTFRAVCSWLGLCPGTKISGGKVLSARTKRSNNRVRQALKMAAMSLKHSDSALGAFYRRLCSRMDKPSANTAVAHKLARMVYFMLTRGEDFVDKGQQHYEEQQRQRSVAALKRRAAALGFEINPTSAVA